MYYPETEHKAVLITPLNMQLIIRNMYYTAYNDDTELVHSSSKLSASKWRFVPPLNWTVHIQRSSS